MIKENGDKFKKGHIPWNKDKTKLEFPQLSNAGVKKNNIPWNKDTKGLMAIPWNKGNKNGEILICSICGKKYYVSKSRKRDSKYCSWECFKESKRRIFGKKHPLYRSIDIKCDWCGKTYQEIPASIKEFNNHFCSRRCHGCYTIYNQKNPSNIEKKLANYLIEHKISFICQFKYKLGIADFYIKPNLIVEVDGVYWHNLPEVKERDKRQTLYLEGEGYKVLHLWENEVNENPQECIKRILKLI